MSEKPICFNPNDLTYPLCKGNGKEECKQCNLYEDLEDESEGK